MPPAAASTPDLLHQRDQSAMSSRQLYESPFTNLSTFGPQGLFSAKALDRIVDVLADVEARAA